MMYRLTACDGTVVTVDEADRDVVIAYLALQGYPAVSVERCGSNTPEVAGDCQDGLTGQEEAHPRQKGGSSG